jgi:hypothetical protein
MNDGGEGRRGRLDELWSRWLGSGDLSDEEMHELAAALAEDGEVREAVLADQRIEGALRALAQDGGAFARRFSERVAAERDSRGFLRSFEERMRVAGLAAPRRRLAWLLAPAALAVAALALWRAPSPRRDAPRVAPPGPLVLAPLPESQARPARGPAGPVARVEHVAGTVFLLDNARRTQAGEGAPLRLGGGIMTVGRDSRATIVFPDRTSFELGGNAALVQIADGDAGGARGKEAFLARGHLTADVITQPAGRPMLITTPQAEAMVVGTRFALNVDVRSTRLDVQKGVVELARVSGGDPVVVHAAEYALVNEGNDPAVIARSRGSALLVVGSLVLTPSDDRIKKRLETLGFEVSLRGSGPPDPEELRHTNVVLLSSSIFSLDVNTEYRDVTVPIVVWEPSLFDDLGMTAPEENGGCGVMVSSGEGLIRDAGHPLAAGLSGLIQLVSPLRDRGGNMRRISTTYGVPGPSAVTVASWPAQPGRALVFAYERGVSMPGLAAAPARRVGLFLYDRMPPQLTDAGWAMFDASVVWAAGASTP